MKIIYFLFVLTIISCSKKDPEQEKRLAKASRDSTIRVISKQVDAAISQSQAEINYVLELIDRKRYIISENNRIVSAYNNQTGDLTLEEVEAKVKKFEVELNYINDKLREVSSKPKP